MDERRQWPRFVPIDTSATIRDAGGREFTAKVLNESVGGAAFCANGDVDPAPGMILTVTLRGSAQSAIVWHVRRQPDGSVVFGVEWLAGTAQ